VQGVVTPGYCAAANDSSSLPSFDLDSREEEEEEEEEGDCTECVRLELDDPAQSGTRSGSSGPQSGFEAEVHANLLNVEHLAAQLNNLVGVGRGGGMLSVNPAVCNEVGGPQTFPDWRLDVP
jgi:hypothetical protein